jgi:ketosteroid isomerase-like protein
MPRFRRKGRTLGGAILGAAMANEAVEAVRRAFEEASRVRDPSGRRVDALDPETLAVVFDFFHPAIEIHEDPRFPEAGVYRGHESAGSYFRQFTESFDEFSFEAEDLLALDPDRVMFLFRLRTRGKGSGAFVEERPGWIFTIQDGKAVRIDTYLDRREALAAAGVGNATD